MTILRATPPKASPPDAHTVFLYGEAYSEAAEKLHTQFTQVEQGKKLTVDAAHRAAPMCVMDALATEIYLKCLYTIDTGGRPAPREHSSLKLFQSLPNKGTQESIRGSYIDFVQASPIAQHLKKRDPVLYREVCTDLERYLELAAKTFERGRYLYEGPGVRLFYWPLLRLAVRRVIISIHPSWEHVTSKNLLQPIYQSH